MTIEEALKIIRKSDECFIVWRTDTGEIIKVKNLPTESSPKDFVEYLSQMTEVTDVKESESRISYSSRFLDSKDVDESFLEKEREEFLTMNHRVKILNQWTSQSVDELITILESQKFPFPTSDSDTYILLERLFDFHWQEIGLNELERLWKLTENENLDEKDKILLKFHLLFIERRKEEFAEFWKQIFIEPHYWISRHIDYYVGDLQITDKEILNDYQNTIAHPQVLFGAKYPAMIALGKIGKLAGEKSAQIIEKVIFDSTEDIIKARDLALKRIRTSSNQWEKCSECRFGRVRGNYGDMITMNDCKRCIGLGWVEI